MDRRIGGPRFHLPPFPFFILSHALPIPMSEREEKEWIVEEAGAEEGH
jgi:hypothetical protein